MIYDKIEKINRYPFLSRIKDFDFNNTSKGKFEIDEDDFFGIGLNYETKAESECQWESHKKYIDIHVILKGKEIVNIADISQMSISKSYDEEGDFTLFKGVKQHSILLNAGDILVLYPNEVHQTAVKVVEENIVEKVVFKYKL